jgi:hypothetical protein
MDVQMGVLLNSKNKRERDLKGAFFPHDFLNYNSRNGLSLGFTCLCEVV